MRILTPRRLGITRRQTWSILNISNVYYGKNCLNYSFSEMQNVCYVKFKSFTSFACGHLGKDVLNFLNSNGYLTVFKVYTSSSIKIGETAYRNLLHNQPMDNTDVYFPKTNSTHSFHCSNRQGKSNFTICTAELTEIVAAESSISTSSLQSNGGHYRGYSVQELSKNCQFEEVLYLLIYGNLPSMCQFQLYKEEIAAQRWLPKQIAITLENIPPSSDPIDVLRIGCCLLSSIDVEGDSIFHQIQVATNLVAKYAAMLFYWHHFSRNRIRISVQSAAHESVVEHFLRLLHASDPKFIVDPLVVETLRTSLILYAENDLSASTFSARLTAATMADTYSGIISAMSVFKGEFHGKITEAVIHFLQQFDSEEDVELKLKEIFRSRKPIHGFCNRLGKKCDSRAYIMKELAKKLSFKPFGDRKFSNITEKVEEVVNREKNLFPTLDFYTACCYKQCLIPATFFSTLLIIARTAGWVAHIMEQRENNKFIRPTSAYIGPAPRPFVPLEKRSYASYVVKSEIYA